MNFTGREDLLKLRESVAGDVTAVVPHALHGQGGVGKTQTAVEYAYRYRGEYDLVWWIPSDQTILVRSARRASPRTWTCRRPRPRASRTRPRPVLDKLRLGEPYHKWLLIFDNADQPEDISDIIPHGPGHVLITSRNNRWMASSTLADRCVLA